MMLAGIILTVALAVYLRWLSELWLQKYAARRFQQEEASNQSNQGHKDGVVEAEYGLSLEFLQLEFEAAVLSDGHSFKSSSYK